MNRELCVTTDFVDNLLGLGRHFEKKDLDAMMKYCASLGAKRHEWILDTAWTIYDKDGPVGYDLLAEACEAAHRHGMRFDVVYKPFEGALSHRSFLPLTMPLTAEAVALEELYGIVPAVRPFVARHPEMRLARRPDEDVDPGGRIAAVRLVKNDDAPLPFARADLTLWTSARNGGFARYEGPVSFEETLEWRRSYPANDRLCRVLTLGGLRLPADTRFVVVRCGKRDENGLFVNEIERIAELVNEAGRVIPSTPTWRRMEPEALFEQRQRLLRLDLCRFDRVPEVRTRLNDRAWFLRECEGMFSFFDWWEKVALDRTGEIALARGKSRHVTGSLSPVYPEVRRHWLDDIRFCIERGVDGVNIRAANHNRPYEPWSYGFNQPVLARSKNPGNVAEARRINGEAYTQFLREARELLHGQAREMGVHVHALMLRHCDRAANLTTLPVAFDWEWPLWVRELADYVEFRGASFLRGENLCEVVDRIGLATREAGIPLIYQCDRSRTIVHFEGPHPHLRHEIGWVRGHPDITTYNLYETAYFSRFSEDGRFEGSPDIVELVRGFWKE